MLTSELPALLDADRLQILDLYGRFALAIDEGDEAAWAACFTADGRFRVGDDLDLAGRERLTEFACAHHNSPNGRARHHVTTVSVESSRQGAAGRAYALLTLGAEVVGAVRYDDELVNDEGAWRFSSRRVSTH